MRYLPVFAGDTVKLRIEHIGESKEFKAKVIEVTPRYGRINRGRTAKNPLLKVLRCGTNEEMHIDNGYVTNIVERYNGPARPPLNIFNEDRWVDLARVRTRKKGVIAGFLVDLASVALRNANFFLPHPVDPERVERLYSRSRIGLVKQERGIYWVNRKPFVRWARQNASRICKTTAQRIKEKTAVNKAYEDDYWRGVDAGDFDS